MRYMKIAVCLAVLIFSFSSLAMGAEFTYSGVPGKWKRGSKEAKGKESEPASARPDLPNPMDPGEKGKRKKTIPVPIVSVTPATPEKK